MKTKFRKPDALVVKYKLKKLFGGLFTYSLLIIISFIILFPFISKLSGSFMSLEDMYDRSVTFIPRHPTLYIYEEVIKALNYRKTAVNSMVLSLLCAVPQTFICAITGYALAKMRSRWGNVVMGLVLLTILVPPQVILVPLYLKFRYFDILGILETLTGQGVNLLEMGNGYVPFLVLSLTGMGFKNGLYIFIFRQFYMGVPEELEEAAYMDGCREFKTFLKIILPISIPVMITVFVFAFAWQMTDTFYTGIFLKAKDTLATSIFVMDLSKIAANAAGGGDFYQNAVLQTGVLLSILPLVLIYIVLQKWIIAGIERSGITG